MPIALSYQIDSRESQTLSGTEIFCLPAISFNQKTEPSEKWVEPITNLPILEPGLDMQVFDRTGKRRDNDFLDIDAETAILSERVNTMESTSSRNTIRDFAGYFYVTTSGAYLFDLPIRNGENAGLGATQAFMKRDEGVSLSVFSI